jgi:hypothetical protein
MAARRRTNPQWQTSKGMLDSRETSSGDRFCERRKFDGFATDRHRAGWRLVVSNASKTAGVYVRPYTTGPGSRRHVEYLGLPAQTKKRLRRSRSTSTLHTLTGSGSLTWRSSYSSPCKCAGSSSTPRFGSMPPPQRNVSDAHAANDVRHKLASDCTPATELTPKESEILRNGEAQFSSSRAALRV